MEEINALAKKINLEKDALITKISNVKIPLERSINLLKSTLAKNDSKLKEKNNIIANLKQSNARYIQNFELSKVVFKHILKSAFF